MSRLLTRLYSSSSPRGLDSHVHRGTAFERRVLALLRSALGMHLRHVGGRGDGGVDLIGWWYLPTHTTHPNRLRVVAQCKAEKRLLGPRHVREMEGVVYRSRAAPDTTSPDGAGADHAGRTTIALLVSSSSFSRAALLRALSSPVPFLLLHVPLQTSSSPPDQDTDESDARLGHAFWNPPLAGEGGVLGGKAQVRWERTGREVGRPGLWWEGHKWTPPPVDDGGDG